MTGTTHARTVRLAPVTHAVPASLSILNGMIRAPHATMLLACAAHSRHAAGPAIANAISAVLDVLVSAGHAPATAAAWAALACKDHLSREDASVASLVNEVGIEIVIAAMTRMTAASVVGGVVLVLTAIVTKIGPAPFLTARLVLPALAATSAATRDLDVADPKLHLPHLGMVNLHPQDIVRANRTLLDEYDLVPVQPTAFAIERARFVVVAAMRRRTEAGLLWRRRNDDPRLIRRLLTRRKHQADRNSYSAARQTRMLHTGNRRSVRERRSSNKLDLHPVIRRAFADQRRGLRVIATDDRELRNRRRGNRNCRRHVADRQIDQMVPDLDSAHPAFRRIEALHQHILDALAMRRMARVRAHHRHRLFVDAAVLGHAVGRRAGHESRLLAQRLANGNSNATACKIGVLDGRELHTVDLGLGDHRHHQTVISASRASGRNERRGLRIKTTALGRRRRDVSSLGDFLSGHEGCLFDACWDRRTIVASHIEGAHADAEAFVEEAVPLDNGAVELVADIAGAEDHPVLLHAKVELRGESVRRRRDVVRRFGLGVGRKKLRTDGAVLPVAVCQNDRLELRRGCDPKTNSMRNGISPTIDVSGVPVAVHHLPPKVRLVTHTRCSGRVAH